MTAQDTQEGLRVYSCPECGGEMYAEHPDRFCLECHHEGRV